MRRILHIVTVPDDGLAEKVISLQRNRRDQEVKVADLTIPDPDYRALLEEIFAADSNSPFSTFEPSSVDHHAIHETELSPV
jgi:hypothetical protein